LAETLLPAQEGDVLELDEVWSFVGHKKNRVWLWFVLCRRTRQIVAWMWGERDALTAQDVWAKVPAQYKHCRCFDLSSIVWRRKMRSSHNRGKISFADGLEAYAHAIPPDQLHQQTQKQHTNHEERFNATLRGRVGRLVRKTLSFSKNLFMHIVHLRLFLHTYNRDCARRYQASHQT